MQASFQCLVHDHQDIAYVCLDQSCAQAVRLLCQKCKVDHPSHNYIAFDAFQKVYKSFQGLSANIYQTIKYNFQVLLREVTERFQAAEDSALKQFCGHYTPQSYPPIDKIELQQLCGIVEESLFNKVFLQMLNGKPAQKTQADFLNKLRVLEIQLDDLKKKTGFTLEQFISRGKSSDLKSQIFNLQAESPFSFSKGLKHQWLAVTEGGAVLERITEQGRGLSAYGIIGQALTPENNQITFHIIRQKHRFMYFGVCLPETFSLFNFSGPLYEKGNGMYAIRQHRLEGQSAISLHNSLDSFSNKQNVGWDFAVGDKLTITLMFEEKKIVFSSSKERRFEMPLDCSGKGLHAFVGMKFEGERVGVVGGR